MRKKRHHFVPEAYLKFFCDAEGKIRAYFKDDPQNPIHLAPRNIAFQKHYYSQPLPEGGRDTNSLEDFFARLESKWPRIVERIDRREDINDALDDIWTFISLQRVRVPAMRDAFERLSAEAMKATARRLDEAGQLPPKPGGCENILELMEVAIDPHRSIHSMPAGLKAMGTVLDRLGIGAIRNETDIPFLTSDNPVIYFDPSVPEPKMQPYNIGKHGGPIVLLFPISPSLLIYGHTQMRNQFKKFGFLIGEVADRRQVKRINRQVCKFAYKTVFARDPGNEALVRKYANTSPVIRVDPIPIPKGEMLVAQSVFGKREPKPKWTQ